MIYITGDTHGTHSLEKLNTISATKGDYVIILGDFGLIWANDEKQEKWLNWLNEKEFTTLFIDGNHENFDLIYGYPIQKYLGGRVHKIKDKIYHLMRGEIFEIDGIKFFAFGGGISIDKMYRTDGVSWWAQEIPTYDEIENGYANLAKNNNKVDYVLTHSAPTVVTKLIISHHNIEDTVTRILDGFESKIVCKHWFFGHHHVDIHLNDKYTVVYNKIIGLT